MNKAITPGYIYTKGNSKPEIIRVVVSAETDFQVKSFNLDEIVLFEGILFVLDVSPQSYASLCGFALLSVYKCLVLHEVFSVENTTSI